MTPFPVPGWLGWPIRVTAFVIVGVLTFMLPSGATALRAQFGGYLVAGAGLLAWALVDLYPGAARYRARVLPVALGVAAAAAGFVTTAGHYENSCADMLASTATTGAGLYLALPAAWMITGVSILAMDANWLIYQDRARPVDRHGDARPARGRVRGPGHLPGRRRRGGRAAPADRRLRARANADPGGLTCGK